MQRNSIASTTTWKPSEETRREGIATHLAAMSTRGTTEANNASSHIECGHLGKNQIVEVDFDGKMKTGKVRWSIVPSGTRGRG